MTNMKDIPDSVIRDLAKQGLSAKEMGQRLGCNPKSIRGRMWAKGIHGRPRGMQKGGRRIVIPIDEPRMASLYQSGMTCKKIAEVLQVDAKNPTETVRRRLAVLGVQRRVGKAVGKDNPQWKGGKHPKSEKDRNRYECYKIVVAFLGMLLPKGWVVHHLDEDPTNNDLSNLALFPSSRHHLSYHQWLLKNSLSGTEDIAIQKVLESDGHLLLPLPDRCESAPDKDLLCLLEMDHAISGTRTKWKEVLSQCDRLSEPQLFWSQAQCTHGHR